MTDPMPRKDVELPPRMPEAATIAELQRALLDARAENARLRADAQATVALALKEAGLAVANVETGFHDGISGDWHPMAGPSIISAACAAIRALAPADGLAAVEALQRDVHSLVAAICDSWDERDRLAAELDATQTQLGNWIVRADEANVRAEKAEAELAAAQQREARLLAAIEEATDPDFILGALDNVNDMDVTLDGFAQAASRAIRAALSHNGRGE